MSNEDIAAGVIQQLEDGRRLVPSHLWAGLWGHVLQGEPTGAFLTNLLANNLMQAVCRADDVALSQIRNIALFLHNYLPAGSWGSAELVKRWREAGGIYGGAIASEERAHG